MLLELWSAEALGLKQGVVGGLMPVRCREVGQRLPESLMSGFMMRTQQEEPRESCLVSQCVSLSSPRMVSSEPNLHVLFPQLSQMWQRLGKRERRLCTPWGGRNETEPLFCFPMEKHFHHQSAICWHGGAGQLVLWIRPPQSRDRLLPNTRVSPSPLTSCQFISVSLPNLPLLCQMKCCWICIFPLPRVLWSYESGKRNTDVKYIIKTISPHITHAARIMTFPQNKWMKYLS